MENGTVYVVTNGPSQKEFGWAVESRSPIEFRAWRKEDGTDRCRVFRLYRFKDLSLQGENTECLCQDYDTDEFVKLCYNPSSHTGEVEVDRQKSCFGPPIQGSSSEPTFGSGTVVF